jgi:hypothetical protein
MAEQEKKQWTTHIQTHSQLVWFDFYGSCMVSEGWTSINYHFRLV